MSDISGLQKRRMAMSCLGDLALFLEQETTGAVSL